MRKQGTQAERYRLVKKAKVSEDTIYTRNDLQKMGVNTPRENPDQTEEGNTGTGREIQGYIGHRCKGAEGTSTSVLVGGLMISHTSLISHRKSVVL